MPTRRKQLNVARLPPFDEESGDLNAVVETVAGSRNKFAYDEALGLFRLKGVLPAGASFPFDFGFVPSTKGGDGDPLDVLVLMDEPAFASCLNNEMRGKTFTPTGRKGPQAARNIVEKATLPSRR